MEIRAVLADAIGKLEAVSESPRLDAELLLARALDVPRSYLFAHPEDEMDATAVKRFTEAVDRRVEGAPLAYITGEKEFWSMTLMVSPDTLVPRPETEALVEQALVRIPRRAEMRILDLGTGSGAIALAIAQERPNCEVVATDICEDALAVARVNAREQSVPNIEFVLSDWTEALAGRTFDLVVSNPPYVADDDPHLINLKHEPRSALAAGEDGLDSIRRIASEAGAVLKEGGVLVLEHGDQQADAVAKILAESGWTNIELKKDLAGLPRVTVAVRGT